jgi:hypothetical protein
VIEQDPTIPGHDVVGCTQIQEGGGDASTSIYNNPCAAPPGADPFTCQLLNVPWNTVFDLGTAAAPGQPADRNVNCTVNTCVFNVPSAVGVRGANIYVGYCGYCDVVTGGLPFISGIATNVGGSAPAKIGAGDGWHTVGAGGNGHPSCTGCGTESAPAPFTGTLPQRYITSIQPDPSDPRTVYVTLGGYGRRWIPPGALGDDVSKVGVGHVFVSHDAGQSFANISGNLPDTPANYTLVHNGQLVVATDLGVFIAAGTSGGNYAQLGTGLPNVPVFTLRTQPGNPNLMVAATYGRGVQKYSFVNAATTTNTTTLGTPNTAAERPLSPVIPGGLAVLGLAAATGFWHRRRLGRRAGPAKSHAGRRSGL